MFITICVIAYNEEQTLPAILKDIAAQDYAHGSMEVVLVDSASSDHTKKIMQEFAAQNTTQPDMGFVSVSVLDNPKRTLPCGWNVALKAYRGEAILKVDAHASIPKDFVTKNVAVLESGEDGCGGQRPNIIEQPTPFRNTLLLAESSMFGSSIAPYRNNPGKSYVKSMFHAAYRRKVFETIGGFDERLARTEDNEIHYRMRKAGFKLCFDPEIISYQHIRPDLGKMLKQKYANGYWIGLTTGVCAPCLSLYHFVPFVYDYANGTSYMLEDRGKYDYSLRLNETDGCLWVVKKAYNSDDIVATGKLLFADNCLRVAYDLKTNCESTPNTETSTSETENTLRTSDTVELIGYVGNSQTSWIELYESTDNKEPIATVPYDLIAALPGCDRKSEAFTFGYLDSITFYYGKIGAFCWCVAALPPAAGTGAANVCTSMDNGETWSISIPDALYTGTVIGAGFASEMVGFISYRYFFDNGPEIARTLDGGKTWSRLELDIPEEYAQYNMQPQNPTFSGNDGSYPIILFDKDGNDRTMALHTHDGGMTWIWPKLSAVDVS